MGLLDNKVALLIGPNAATWDQDKHAQAVQMKLNGVNPEEIRQKTGIFWGPDGKARTEIDDSAATLTGDSGTLGNALDHKALYDAYPSLNTFPAVVKRASLFDAPFSGSYSPDGIEVTAEQGRLKDTFLHEIQHAIQQKEGFAFGGAPAGWHPGGTMTAEDYQAYLRIAGEAEARAVAARANLTQGQRNAKNPLDSYDIPLNELTYR